MFARILTPNVMSCARRGGSMSIRDLARHADQTWVNRLPIDPDSAKHAPNKTMREVKKGLYVPVKPTPLPNPKLIISSADMMGELDLDLSCQDTPDFRDFLSGHHVMDEFTSWATPYALSIYGREMTDNCPFKNGNGYGDGRAISIAEVSLPQDDSNNDVPRRWELQLKGAGTTPFHRGGDGRAVLRSSIREFLASEAMHHLGVSTTRALSLCVSGTETVNRPWYSGAERETPDFENHPALKQYPPEIRGQLIAQLKSQLQQPDRMQNEPAAITCRAAPSFIRVGHLELCYRRWKRATSTEKESALHDLEAMVELALLREYPHIPTDQPISSRAVQLLDAFSVRLSKLTADWIRVGFCQGNFNSDNCLVGGRTMDYGPFGFIERYEPLWNMWSGGGDHFAFMNQPMAGTKNLSSCVTALLPLMEGDDDALERAMDLVDTVHPTRARDEVNDTFRRKLGLLVYDEATQTLKDDVLSLMEATQADWTLFWRALSELIPSSSSSSSSST
eukprot:TRINITY_DN11245_c0_g1_i1.p1 TRINITY_DN11245_c0_g1~~TRINITY_DN11245_c0_g1_i1.p1  ORF type:complete len:506 (+),score=100.34 TRINITY_DN11245_c0_g1_i1:138-1655(+)